MPPTAWYAAIGVLVFCLVWRLGFYVLWRRSFGGRPAGRTKRPADAGEVVTLRRDGSRVSDTDS